MPTADPTDSVRVQVDARGVAEVVLNRPAVNNAYDGVMIENLLSAVRAARADDAIRVVVIRGEGRHFQAGADLAWIRSVRDLGPDDNHAVSTNTANAIRELNELNKPTIALIHGACFGGGTGMAAACDVVLASDDALFSITEARWGLNAAIIVPVLTAAIGARNARRYALTAERFDAVRAAAIGLVHEIVPAGKLDEVAAPIIDALLHVAPQALATMKEDFVAASAGGVSDEHFNSLIQKHADGRQLPEADEGLASFLEKRKPNWYPG